MRLLRFFGITTDSQSTVGGTEYAAPVGANRRRFVPKAVAGKGRRVWDTLRKRWWGKVHTAPPEELLTELNGETHGERVVAISTEISRRKKK